MLAQQQDKERLDSPCHSTMTTAPDEDHDYDELYFEPACKEEELFQQLKNLNVSIISKDRLQ